MHSDVVIVLCAEEGVACGGEEDAALPHGRRERTSTFGGNDGA